MRLRARLIAEIATAGGRLIPFDEGPEFLMIFFCLEALTFGVAMMVLQALTLQSLPFEILETVGVTFGVLAVTEILTPDFEYGYCRVPWQRPPGSDEPIANGT